MRYEKLPNGMFMKPLEPSDHEDILLGNEESVIMVPPRPPTLSEIIDDVKEGLMPTERPDC